MASAPTLREYRRRFLIWALKALGVAAMLVVAAFTFEADIKIEHRLDSRDLPAIGAGIALFASVISFLGFLVTSAMAIRKDRRERALFELDIRTKELQLAELRAKATAMVPPDPHT